MSNPSNPPREWFVPPDAHSFIPDPLYAAIYHPLADGAKAAAALIGLAGDFSPRYQCQHDTLMTIDIRGLDRLFGDPRRLGDEIRRSALVRGLRVHVGIAATQAAAMVLALARPGLTVVPRGGEAAAIAAVAIGILEKIPDRRPGTSGSPRHRESSRSVHSEQPLSGQRSPRSSDPPHSATAVLSVVKSWGLRTLGELAALPSSDLSARLGQQGLAWQALARGQDAGPLVPTIADERFESSIELEWPIEGLEPLSFVLTRLLEPLSTRLERRDRGAAAIHVTLGLVNSPDIQRAHLAHPVDQATVYTRSLQLPSPLRDVRALRTLILLDLESHSPAGPIERVTVVIEPTPGRVLQHALFVRAHPTPEQLSTLLARLHALMGADRVGRPAQVDSYRPGAFAMQPFATDHDGRHDIDHRDHRAHRETRRGVNRGGPPPLSPQSRESSAQKDGGVSSVISVPSVVNNSASSAASALSVAHQPDPPCVISALRRCRRPVPARVTVAAGRPVAVTTDRRGYAGGHVQACAGPWRTSGEWWECGSEQAGQAGQAGRARQTPHPSPRPGLSDSPRLSHQPDQPCSWDRDEWEVSLSDGAVYRIFQDRETERWFIDAIVD
jgi:hypothetical protein